MEIEFYNIVIYAMFVLSGYSSLSIKSLLRALLPVYSIGTGFTSSYLVFFFFIPYLNLLIRSMNEEQHIILSVLFLMIGTIFPTFLKASNAFTYVGWFMVLYFFASYIRISPKAIFCKDKIWGRAALVSLLLSWGSVIGGAIIYNRIGLECYYYFVVDSNKLFAVTTAVFGFLFFKNLHIKYHPVINKIAASTFGVLLTFFWHNGGKYSEETEILDIGSFFSSVCSEFWELRF